jgi:hypothetical protein
MYTYKYMLTVIVLTMTVLNPVGFPLLLLFHVFVSPLEMRGTISVQEPRAPRRREVGGIGIHFEKSVSHKSPALFNIP